MNQGVIKRLLSLRRSTRGQLFFARLRPWREWTMIAGEGVALVVAVSIFMPWVPSCMKEIAIPVAVVVGSSAILLVAIFDKLDPTRRTTVSGDVPPDKIPGLVRGLPDGATYIQRDKGPSF